MGGAKADPARYLYGLAIPAKPHFMQTCYLLCYAAALLHVK